MPRRTLLSESDRAKLLALPESHDDLIRQYAFTQTDLSLIEQRRGDSNRLGFAVQLCLLRYPGYALSPDLQVPDPIIQWIAQQVQVDPRVWPIYAQRDNTRLEHLQELRSYLALSTFGYPEYRSLVLELTGLALQTDKGVLLAEQALALLRKHQVILPPLTVIDRICSAAVTRANRRIYASLTDPLSAEQRQRLDALLQVKPGHSITWLVWLRQAPLKPNSNGILEHIERLKAVRALALPETIGKDIHQNRLLKLARVGGVMPPFNLIRLDDHRRYATLVAVILECSATLTDELIELHDRILLRIFSVAKNKHEEQFHDQGKAINDKVRLYAQIGHALVKAKTHGTDPYAAIESVIPWGDFTQSITEADKLARAESFDHLHLIRDQYSTLRRYTPELLAVLELRAAPAAQGILDGVEMVRRLNDKNLRAVPDDAPTAFIKSRWGSLVRTGEGLDRRFYELCVISELRNALRSGDIWVKGSRQFRDFDDYLLPVASFEDLKRTNNIPVAVTPVCEHYLHARLHELNEQMALVNRLAIVNQLPDAILTETGLKITPQDAQVPDDAQALIDRTSRMLPRIKITELLMDVDEWTDFTRHFTHVKDDKPAKDRLLLLSTILADGINLGLSKMAESCPGTTYDVLSWLNGCYIRQENYLLATADLVNAQLRQPFAQHWGDGRTSSSDGQRFRSGGQGESTGHINPKYGNHPGRMI